MRIVSLNVSLPRPALYRDRFFDTGIFKTPVQGRLAVRGDNLEGDGQADLSVHGGPDKAVYAYPSEHYAYWREILGLDLEWGGFGENLTTEGLDEASVRIGDRYRIGTALFKVTQPRLPCFKLAMKLGRDDIVDLFRASGRSGFYLAVVEEGGLGPGDAIELVEPGAGAVTVAEVNRLERESGDSDLLERVLSAPDLSASRREHFEKRRRGGS